MQKNKKTGKKIAYIFVWAGIIIFSIYFSVFTVLRYWKLVASYYDLGIMHQTVYNTYRSLQTFDFSRFLEITNPHGFEQVKRMAVHNDIFLALLAPFYFIHDSPATLLILQSVIVGMGAYAVFLLTLFLFKKYNSKYLIGVFFAFSYLLYPPLQRSVIYEFHAVTVSTTFLLCMYYFWVIQKYKTSLIFFVLSLMTKEHMGLVTGFFGLFVFFQTINPLLLFKKQKKPTPIFFSKKIWKRIWYPLLVIAISVIWFIISIKMLIPAARPQGGHFAIEYYSDLANFTKYIFRKDTVSYFVQLLSPVGFLSLFSLPHFLIAGPEFAINLLSSNFNMRNTIYHYTAVITPFIFISSLYGFYHAFLFLVSIQKESQKINKEKIICIGGFLLLATSIITSYLYGPLPYAKNNDVYALTQTPKVLPEIQYWSKKLKGEHIKVSATGHFAPYFTSRRYFYNFSEYYVFADYVIVSIEEARRGWQKDITSVAYDKLRYDPDFFLVYKHDDLEVYKKIKKLSQ